MVVESQFTNRGRNPAEDADAHAIYPLMANVDESSVADRFALFHLPPPLVGVHLNRPRVNSLPEVDLLAQANDSYRLRFGEGAGQRQMVTLSL